MTSEHLQKYLNRIESQHRVRPRYMQHVETLLEMVDGAYDVIRNTPEKFNIDTAVGAQLDVIGNRLGVSRSVDIPGSTYYGYELNDDEYRAFIYARIFRNHWDGTDATFQVVWDNTLGRIVDANYTDNQDMTATISIGGEAPDVIMEMILAGELIPKPVGVGHIVAYDNARVNIIVSVGADYYEVVEPAYPTNYALEPGEEDHNTYVKPMYETSWNPVWMYILMHSANPNVLADIPAVQAIMQKFQEFYGIGDENDANDNG